MAAITTSDLLGVLGLEAPTRVRPVLETVRIAPTPRSATPRAVSTSPDPARKRKVVDAVSVAGQRTGMQLWWYFTESPGEIMRMPPAPLAFGTQGGLSDHEPDERQQYAVKRARGVESVLGMLSYPHPGVLRCAFQPLPPGLPKEWTSAFGDLSLVVEYAPPLERLGGIQAIIEALRPKTADEMLVIEIRLAATALLKDACRNYSMMRRAMGVD